MALTTNLEALWPLLEGSGTNSADATANGRNLAFTNAPSWVTGKGGNGGLGFNVASVQYASATGYAGVTGTAARSIAIWFKSTTATTAANYFFGWGTNSLGHLWRLSLETSGIIWMRGNTATGNWGGSLADGAWHHVVLTFPASGLMRDVICYIDGVAVTVNSFNSGTTALDTGISTVIVGGDPNTLTADFTGSLSQPAIWSRVLSASDVTELWNSGNGTLISFTGIVATDLTANRVYQRTKNTTAKTITFAGTYTGADPASIEVEIVRDGTSITVQDWTAISSPTIGSGSWSGSLSVPQGNYWYNFLARSKDSGGSVLATSTQTSNKWGVGILVAMLGQSNMRNMFDTSSSPPTMNGLTRRYNGSWGNVVGNGAILFSDLVQLQVNCPVGLLDYAVNGSGLVYNDGSGTWDSATAGQPYPLFVIGLTAVGGDCEFVLWHQGEADAKGATSKAVYKAALDTLYGQIRTATGRSTSELTFGCPILGPFLTSPSTDDSVSVIRDAHVEWGRGTIGGFCSGSCVDMTLIDNVHWDAASYERIARRYANAVLHELGITDFGSRGPVVQSSFRTSNMIFIRIQRDGGTELGLLHGGDMSAIEASITDFALNLITNSVNFDGTDIVITLNSTPPSSAVVKIRYQYGQQPPVSNPLYDDYRPQGDSLGLPLQPIYEAVAPLAPPNSTGVTAIIGLPFPAF
jgi:hypothetical protein